MGKYYCGHYTRELGYHVSTKYPVNVTVSNSSTNIDNTTAQIKITVNASFTINTYTMSSGLMCIVTCNGIKNPGNGYTGIIGNGNGTTKYSYGTTYTTDFYFNVSRYNTSYNYTVDIYSSYDLLNIEYAGQETDIATVAPPLHKVTYNANSGTGHMEPSTATYGKSFKTQKNAFTKSGYIFNGWKHWAPDGREVTWSLNGEGMYESGIPWTWTYDYDVTLYAQWIKNKYTITFDGNGGLVDSSSEPILYEKKYKVDFSLSNVKPTRDGYTFKYWLAKKADVAIPIGTGVCFYVNNTYIRKVWLRRITDVPDTEKKYNASAGWEILVYAPGVSEFWFPTWFLPKTGYYATWIKANAGNWNDRNGLEYNYDDSTKSWNIVKGEYIFDEMSMKWRPKGESDAEDPNKGLFNFGTWIETGNFDNTLVDYVTHLYAYGGANQTNQLSAYGGLPYYSMEFYPEDSYSYNQDITFYAQWRPNVYDLNINWNGGNYLGDTETIIDNYFTFGEGFSQFHHALDGLPTRDYYEYDGLYDQGGTKVIDENMNAIYSNDTYFQKNENGDYIYIFDDHLLLYAHWKPLNLAYYKLNGEWVLCNSYIKVKGVWEPAIYYKNTNGDYTFEISVLTDTDDNTLTDENGNILIVID